MQADQIDTQPKTVRHLLEGLHESGSHADAIDTAWKYLGSKDRFIRHAARVTLELTSPQSWQDRAIAEPDATSRMTAILALARAGDPSQSARILSSLDQIKWDALDAEQRLALLRCYELTLIRMRPPDSASLQSGPAARLEKVFPSDDRLLDPELCKLLVFLQSKVIASKTLPLLTHGATKQEQLQYALLLSHLRAGWTPQARREYFDWLDHASTWQGGRSLAKYIETIRSDAHANLPPDLRGDFAVTPARNSQSTSALVHATRPFVRKWTLDDLLPLNPHQLAGRDTTNGRRLFGEATCFACHRIAGEGGTVGPDLTAVAGRFNTRDLLESMISPSKVISDQFAATTLVKQNGQIVTGRVVNLTGDTLMIQADMLQPANLLRIPNIEIDEMARSPISLMPAGLLDTLTKNEILDLMAFMLRGRSSVVGSR